MAIWSEGDFTFKPGEETDNVTIHLSNANLMMEAARRLDEWRVLSRKIPSLDLIPFFTSRDQSGPGHPEPSRVDPRHPDR